MENTGMIEDHKHLLQKLDDFCFGNGNIGVNKRLVKVEDMTNGTRECSTMKEVSKHLEWHEKMSNRRWEVTVGMILLVAGQILTIVMMMKGGK